jgi:phage terminase large subunit-like protein
MTRLAALPASDRAAILAAIPQDQLAGLLHDWRAHGRPDQLPPQGDWDIWLILAGRGWGKTRTGAEWVREQVEAGAKRIALVAETQKDLEEVMIGGDSGLLSVFPEHQRPVVRYKPVKVTFHTGAEAYGYNATQPDQLRGPQFDAAWLDELAKWRYAQETWDMLQFALRLGDHPRQVVTTTPRPIELLKSILAGKEGKIAVTRGATQDNAANLAPGFLHKITERYAGTRLGRQELNAEVLGDLPGALWTLSVLDTWRVSKAPDTTRVVVAVDPAVTSGEEADEHGIIVAGLTREMRGVVLEDATMRGSPSEWARRAVSLYRSWRADAIIVEVNQGGDMVKSTIRTIDPYAHVIEVRATRGKHVRAEPIAALYEQGKIVHVGAFPELEVQMTQMTTAGYGGPGSPDRVDALVWAFTDLFREMTAPIKADDWEAEDTAYGRSEATGY